MSEEDRFEIALYEYVIVIKELRHRAIQKYGMRANEWFGIK